MVRAAMGNGRAPTREGAVERAQNAAREGLRLGTMEQDPWAISCALLQLGTIALAREDTAAARNLIAQSVTIFTNLGDPGARLGYPQ